MSTTAQRLLLLGMVVAFYSPVHAQLACCQLELVGDPVSVSPGLSPISVAFSPNGACIAVANQNTDNISIFTVNPNCSLNTPATIQGVGNLPRSVAFSPTGNCLAVANSADNTISVFTVNPDCTLNTPATTYGTMQGVGIAPESLAFSPSGTCLAVTNIGNIGTDNVSLFTVDSECNLNHAGTFGVGDLPLSVAFSPTGDCLAVANFNSNTISVFTVNPNCTLNPPITYGTMQGVGIGPRSVAFSPDGTCLAVANQISNTISVFNVNSNCTLNIPATTYDMADGVGTTPSAVAFSPDGICLAVANQNSSNVSVFRVIGCSLTSVPGSPFPIPMTTPNAPRPLSLAFSPTNNCLAVTSLGSNDVSMFSVVIAQQPIITSAIVTNCNSVTVTGTSSPNAFITLFVDGNPNTTGFTDNNGDFIIITTPLSDGTHTITAVATILGCTSTPSEPVIVTIDIPVITSVSVGCGNLVTVRGTSVPNSMVSIAIGTPPVQIATGMTNSEGTFIFTGIQLPSGFQCFTAVDTASGCSSIPVCVNVSSLSCTLSGSNLAFGTHCNRW